MNSLALTKFHSHSKFQSTKHSCKNYITTPTTKMNNNKLKIQSKFQNKAHRHNFSLNIKVFGDFVVTKNTAKILATLVTFINNFTQQLQLQPHRPHLSVISHNTKNYDKIAISTLPQFRTWNSNLPNHNRPQFHRYKTYLSPVTLDIKDYTKGSATPILKT